jgi:hypothetical protein
MDPQIQVINYYRLLLLPTFTQILCIKLVIIIKLYYDARPTKYQDNYYLFGLNYFWFIN